MEHGGGINFEIVQRRSLGLAKLIGKIKRNEHPDAVRALLNSYGDSDRAAILGLDYYFTTHSDYLPLHVAITNGRTDIARLLIVEYLVPVNQEGDNSSTMRGTDMRWDTVTPLYLACHCQQENIVRLLLQLSNAKPEPQREVPNIDNEFTGGQTVLSKACFDGNYNIVKMLVEYHANIFNETSPPLVCVVEGWKSGGPAEAHDFQSRLAIIDYLRQCGASMAVTKSGLRTLLHLAAERNHVDCITELIARGAPAFAIDEQGLTPAMLAACLGHSAAVQALSELHDGPMSHIITSFELLGAVLVLKEATLQQGCDYMRKAMLLREQHKIVKQAQEGPIDDFYTERECNTSQELEQIFNNRVRLSLESEFVFQRTLGMSHDLTMRHASEVAKVLFATADNLLAVKHLLITAEKRGSAPWLDQMLSLIYNWCTVVPRAPGRPVGAVLRRTLALLGMRGYPPSRLKDWKKQVSENVKWVIAFAELIITQFPAAEEYGMLRGLVELIAKENLRDSRGRSLLHIAIIRGLRATVVPFLIDCGHDVNSFDLNGNTPLHLAVACDLPNGEEIVSILAANGAHPDFINNAGQRPIDRCHTASTWNALRRYFVLDLKCLAARATSARFHDDLCYASHPFRTFLNLHRRH